MFSLVKAVKYWLICFSPDHVGLFFPCIDPVYLFFSLYWPSWFVFLPVLTWFIYVSPCPDLVYLYFSLSWPGWFVFPLYWPSLFVFLPVLTRLVCFSPCTDPVGLFFSLYWPGQFIFLPVLTRLVCFSPYTDLVCLFFSLYWPGQFVFLPVDAVRSWTSGTCCWSMPRLKATPTPTWYWRVPGGCPTGQSWRTPWLRYGIGVGALILGVGVKCLGIKDVWTGGGDWWGWLMYS